jgi:hypothetical protein
MFAGFAPTRIFRGLLDIINIAGRISQAAMGGGRAAPFLQVGTWRSHNQLVISYYLSIYKIWEKSIYTKYFMLRSSPDICFGEIFQGPLLFP